MASTTRKKLNFSGERDKKWLRVTADQHALARAYGREFGTTIELAFHRLFNAGIDSQPPAARDFLALEASKFLGRDAESERGAPE